MSKTRTMNSASDDDKIDPRAVATQQLTQFSVELFEEFTQLTDKNNALGFVIEALSETLGNMISLVKEDYQQEVIATANEVIQQGLMAQQELIAAMNYGQVGHA
jgi:hypothetical protein